MNIYSHQGPIAPKILKHVSNSNSMQISLHFIQILIKWQSQRFAHDTTAEPLWLVKKNCSNISLIARDAIAENKLCAKLLVRRTQVSMMVVILYTFDVWIFYWPITNPVIKQMLVIWARVYKPDKNGEKEVYSPFLLNISHLLKVPLPSNPCIFHIFPNRSLLTHRGLVMHNSSTN